MNTPERLAVVGYSPNGSVNGSLLDALDATAFLERSGLPVELVLVGFSPVAVARITGERYPESRAIARARFCRFRFSVPRTRYARVLAGYGSFRRLAGWIRAEHWLVLPSQRLRMDARIGKIRDNPRAVFLLDPQQHDYPVSCRRDYVKKVLPPRAPEHPPEPALLVNRISPHKRHPLRDLADFISGVGAPGQVRILSGRPLRDLPGGWEWLRPPVDDLFGKFTDYLYVYPTGGYDENPRLLIESLLLGRRVHVLEGDALEPACAAKLRRVMENPREFVYREDDPLVAWMREGVR